MTPLRQIQSLFIRLSPAERQRLLDTQADADLTLEHIAARHVARRLADASAGPLTTPGGETSELFRIEVESGAAEAMLVLADELGIGRSAVLRQMIFDADCVFAGLLAPEHPASAADRASQSAEIDAELQRCFTPQASDGDPAFGVETSQSHGPAYSWTAAPPDAPEEPARESVPANRSAVASPPVLLIQPAKTFALPKATDEESPIEWQSPRASP
jgi:hypothetical protein